MAKLSIARNEISRKLQREITENSKVLDQRGVQNLKEKSNILEEKISSHERLTLERIQN